MASHRKHRRSRQKSIKELLFGTQRRILASAGAVVTLTGAISGVSGLLHKSAGPEALDATFSAVKAYPEVSLEQYDARSGAEGGIAGAPGPVKTGMVAYRLAAYATSSQSTATISREGTPSTSTNTDTSPAASSSNLSQGSSKVAPIIPRLPVIHPTPIRPGGKITTTTTDVPFPVQPHDVPEPSGASPPKKAFHQVAGARVTDGTGASQGKVNAVLAALAHIGVAEAETPSSTPEEGKESTTTSTTTAPPPGSGHSGSPAPFPGPTGEPRHVVLPKSCSSLCGATQEIDKALTYDPNPVRAAEAVAAIFSDSRGEVVGQRLYPIGAMVSYTINLDGFAHRKATLKWSLFATGGRRPPPKPWWRDVVVAHIEPVVSHESLAGTFWVPVPPERGDYVVHLELLDANGVSHASSDSEPDFH
jgi:hypothetical protein